jgi:hypothetical protein
MPPYDVDGFVLCSHGRPIRCIECGDEYARDLAQPGVSHRLHREVVAHHAERAEAAEAQRNDLLNALADLLLAMDLLFSYSPSRRTDAMWDAVDRNIKHAKTVLRTALAEAPGSGVSTECTTKQTQKSTDA